MKRVYTLPEANQILVLISAIAAEFVERREARRRLQRERTLLENANTPEGLRQELSELDAQIYEQDSGLRECRRELEDLGLTVLHTSPLTLHIPGNARSGPVVFCWQEGERSVCYGHAIGEEEENRRPLRLKAG